MEIAGWMINAGKKAYMPGGEAGPRIAKSTFCDHPKALGYLRNLRGEGR
jgi:hypothetical protein